MEEEWEVCNDGGFIYKRRRRHLTQSSSPASHPPEEETQGRSRRIASLSKIRDRYRHELTLWEHLSDACRSTRENAEREKMRAQLMEGSSSREDVSVSGGTDTANLVDKLLLQAERQEAVVCDLTRMCDYAEALCDAQEEQFKVTLLDLPIWASPQRLMAALCDE